MTYYANIYNNKIDGCSQVQITSEGLSQIEITKEVFDNIERYEYKNGEIVEIEDWEEQQRKAKRKAEILLRLDEIDRICIRALRANETDRIQAYEEECTALREELSRLV